jgi:RNA polymerase sigma-70 factor (ECF subfamily)
VLVAVIKAGGTGHGASMRSASDRPDSEPVASAPPISPPHSRPAPASDAEARAFSALIRSELSFVWRVLRRAGLSSADADDATQQVFLVASRRREHLAHGKERSFLYGTALRIAANLRRGLARRREAPESVAPPAASAVPLADELFERQRARQLLDELLAQLPEELARVMVLAEVEGLTLAAIAELEGIPPGTAASRLRRARTAFRELLQIYRDRNPFAGSVP